MASRVFSTNSPPRWYGRRCQTWFTPTVRLSAKAIGHGPLWARLQAGTIVTVGAGGERVPHVGAPWQRDTRTLNANLRRRGLQPPFT